MRTKAFLHNDVLRVWQGGRILYEMPIADDPDALALYEQGEPDLHYVALMAGTLIGHVLDTPFVPGGEVPVELIRLLSYIAPAYAFGRHYYPDEVIALGQEVWTAKQDFWASDPRVEYEPRQGENDYFKRWSGLTTTYPPATPSPQPEIPKELTHNPLYGLGLEDRYIEIHNYSAQVGSYPWSSGVIEYANTRDDLDINFYSLDGAPASALRLWEKVMEYKSPEALAAEAVAHHILGIKPMEDTAQMLLIAPHWQDGRRYLPRIAVREGEHIYQALTDHIAQPAGLPPSQSPDLWAQIEGVQ